MDGGEKGGKKGGVVVLLIVSQPCARLEGGRSFAHTSVLSPLVCVPALGLSGKIGQSFLSVYADV
jgi:hypothetical protein